MRPALASIIVFHWVVLFALLAAVSLADPGRGPLAAYELLGAEVTPAVAAAPLPSALGSTALAFTAVLFAWAFISLAFGLGDAREEGVVTLAFGAGVALLSFAFAAGFILPVQHHVQPLIIHTFVLAASYVAIIVPVPGRTGTRRATSEPDPIARAPGDSGAVVARFRDRPLHSGLRDAS